MAGGESVHNQGLLEKAIRIHSSSVDCFCAISSILVKSPRFWLRTSPRNCSSEIEWYARRKVIYV